jgi:sialidase-1
LASTGPGSADEILTHVDVFTSGTEGYHTFRIPAIETAPDGTLIAFAEARKYNSADPGFHGNDIDLVSKRSTDGGKTWSKLKVIDDPGERWAACNPATTVDRTTGRVWLFNVRTKPGCSSYTSRPGTDDAQNWVRYSADNGATWSEPVEVTRIARDVGNWGCSAFGPGGAIQDRRGRLIAPVSKTTGRKDASGKPVGGPWNGLVIFSEDHGKTFQRGGLLPGGDWCSEAQLVELADGRILIDCRQMSGPHRNVATSSDGCRTWSKPQPGVPVTPVACAIERMTLKSAGDDRNRIIWTGPKGPGRANLVVRVSYDEGETFPVERMIAEEPAAYSDLTVLKDKTAGVLWERAGYKYITFTRFNLEFLEPNGR